MKLKLIYPKWPKMPNQPEFHLPPHGPVCFAATLPEYVDIDFTDENVEPLVFDADADLVAISCMLTCQIPRGWEIADQYRALGKTVPVCIRKKLGCMPTRFLSVKPMAAWSRF